VTALSVALTANSLLGLGLCAWVWLTG